MSNESKQEKLKIIFMGTPDFSVPVLEKIANNENFEILFVVTQNDKKVGRKQIITPPPVKIKAQDLNLKILQSEKISEIKDKLIEAQPDLFVVVAFGQILPKSVLDIPKYGAINIHASLLPKYRGSAVMQAPILNGDKETGVTFMKMDEGLDTGPILKQIKISIDDEETIETLHDKLSKLGADNISDIIIDFITSKITPVSQDNLNSTYAKEIKKEDGRINWSLSAETIERKIRAYTPWPSVFTFLESKSLKILKVNSKILDINNYKAGELFLFEKKLAVQCGQDALIIENLQLEGKTPITGEEFLRGHNINEIILK